jgi:four helix bundle protein
MDKKFDLEERSQKFARSVRVTLNKFEKTIINMDDFRQLIRSSGSVGANYIEANESLSKKDFKYRIKICRKEAKESVYWLNIMLVKESEQELVNELKKEALELQKIFGAILTKMKGNENSQSHNIRD